MASRKMALVTCSTRGRRLNPYITSYIQQFMTPLLQPDICVEVIDLADQKLPLFDEPKAPATLEKDDPTPHYAEKHTRCWSSLVRRYDAFIFITPQYNWSIPASLKNALDFLYHEWTGKPAGIVTYGGRGGGKAALHLRDVVSGLRMKPAPTAPGLVTTPAMMDHCKVLGCVGGDDLERWRGAGVEEQLRALAEQMRALILAA